MLLRYKKSVSILFLFLTLSIWPLAVTNADTQTTNSSGDTIDLMKKWGQAERKIMNQKAFSNEAYAKGKTITIERQEIEIIAARYDLQGITNGEESAYTYLLRREALHQIAKRNGYTVTQKEALDYVNKQKEFFKNISDPAFSAYLEGIGMSVDEYWDSQYEILKNELLTEQFLQAEKKKYIKDHNIINWSDNENNAWQQYLDDMAQEYISADNVKEVE